MPVNLPTSDELFPELSGFAHRDIFSRIVGAPVWMALEEIHGYILEIFPKGDGDLPEGLRRMDGPGDDAMLYCDTPLVLDRDLVYDPLKIAIGAGTKIEPTAVIKGPALIGASCDVRQGAYLRGDLITGTHCTLGHTTEMKNSIIMNHSEAGHFNYVGDCIIGSYVNLGAGTKLANLKFRSPEDKRAVAFPVITFTCKGRIIDTGLAKIGAVIGDHCETGCNSVISPAVLLGTECWVYPNATVPSGVYPAKSFIRPSSLKPKVGQYKRG